MIQLIFEAASGKGKVVFQWLKIDPEEWREEFECEPLATSR